MTSLRTLLVVFSALVLQVALFSDLEIAGVSPDVMLVVAVAAGLTGGPDRGAALGFVAGLAMDLVLTTPFGLSALAYGLTGYVVGLGQNAMQRPTWWMSTIAGFAGTIMGIVTFVVVGELLNQPHLYTSDIWKILAITAALNAALTPVVVPVVRWGGGGWADERRRTLRSVVN